MKNEIYLAEVTLRYSINQQIDYHIVFAKDVIQAHKKVKKLYKGNSSLEFIKIKEAIK